MNAFFRTLLLSPALFDQSVFATPQRKTVNSLQSHFSEDPYLTFTPSFLPNSVIRLRKVKDTTSTPPNAPQRPDPSIRATTQTPQLSHPNRIQRLTADRPKHASPRSQSTRQEIATGNKSVRDITSNRSPRRGTNTSPSELSIRNRQTRSARGYRIHQTPPREDPIGKKQPSTRAAISPDRTSRRLPSAPCVRAGSLSLNDPLQR